MAIIGIYVRFLKCKQIHLYMTIYIYMPQDPWDWSIDLEFVFVMVNV